MFCLRVFVKFPKKMFITHFKFSSILTYLETIHTLNWLLNYTFPFSKSFICKFLHRIPKKKNGNWKSVKNIFIRFKLNVRVICNNTLPQDFCIKFPEEKRRSFENKKKHLLFVLDEMSEEDATLFQFNDWVLFLSFEIASVPMLSDSRKFYSRGKSVL